MNARTCLPVVSVAIMFVLNAKEARAQHVKKSSAVPVSSGYNVKAVKKQFIIIAPVPVLYATKGSALFANFSARLATSLFTITVPEPVAGALAGFVKLAFRHPVRKT